MVKFLSVVLILTMMTGLCQVTAYAAATQSIIPNIRKYGADLVARSRLVNLAGLTLLTAKWLPQRQSVANQVAALETDDARTLAAETSFIANSKPLLALAGTDGTRSMTIERIRAVQAIPTRMTAFEARGLSLERQGHNQRKSIPRIRGHDGAILIPTAPNDS